QLVEELAGVPHERPPLLILMPPRSFPDEHDPRLGIPLARHTIRRGSRELAQCTSSYLVGDLGENLSYIACACHLNLHPSIGRTQTCTRRVYETPIAGFWPSIIP